MTLRMVATARDLVTGDWVLLESSLPGFTFSKPYLVSSAGPQGVYVAQDWEKPSSVLKSRPLLAGPASEVAAAYRQAWNLSDKHRYEQRNLEQRHAGEIKDLFRSLTGR